MTTPAATQERKGVVMNRFFKYFAIGAVAGLVKGTLTARADLEVSASSSVHAMADFYVLLPPGDGQAQRKKGDDSY